MRIQLILAACLAAFILPASADDTELGKKMEDFNDLYKSLRREEDPAKGAATAREAQQLVAQTLDLVPEMLTKMPDGPAKASALSTYRQMMGQVYVQLCKIEQAYLAKDMDKAAALYAELKEMKSAGHDKFVEEE